MKMPKCLCGYCQQMIGRNDYKKLLQENEIVCPHCGQRLALNPQAQSIAYLALAVLLAVFVFILKRWLPQDLFSSVVMLLVISFVLLGFAVGEPIAKRLSLAFCRILPLPFAAKPSGDAGASFLSLARLGLNDSWRYLLFLFIIFSGITQLGVVPLLSLDAVLNPGGDPLIGSFYELMASTIPIVVAIYIAVEVLHKRPFRSLITGAEQIRWQRILQGAGIYFAIGLGFTAVSFMFYPEEYVFTFDSHRFARFLPFVLVLTPFQVMSEELLCRGYIMQGLGLLMDKWGAVVLSALVFALPHLANPDVRSMPMTALCFMFIVGVFLALITIKDGTLELAIGVHITQNIASFLLVAPNEGLNGLPLPALYTSKSSAFSVDGIIGLLIATGLFWLIAFKWFPRAKPLAIKQGQV